MGNRIYDDDARRGLEHRWSGIGMVLCFISFIIYLYIQYKSSTVVAEDIINDARVEGIKHGHITLRGAMDGIILINNDQQQQQEETTTTTTTLDMPLMILNHHIPLEHIRQMRKLLTPFFQYYDVNRGSSIVTIPTATTQHYHR